MSSSELQILIELQKILGNNIPLLPEVEYYDKALNKTDIMKEAVYISFSDESITEHLETLTEATYYNDITLFKITPVREYLQSRKLKSFI